MIPVDGFIVDARTMPPEVQEVAGGSKQVSVASWQVLHSVPEQGLSPNGPQTPLVQISEPLQNCPSLQGVPLTELPVPRHTPTWLQMSGEVQLSPSWQGAPDPTNWQLNLQQLFS